ncbi:MAG: hypothetical protein U0V87_15370 [Acidobacteriota bacterium]
MNSRRRVNRVAVIAWALLAAEPLRAIEAGPPIESGVQESVDVRLVQMDVTVVDRRSGGDKLVTGLTREQFTLRLDGQPLSAEQQQRLSFDEVCTSADQPAPIIAIVDFNYLDAKSRVAIAEELDKLADRVSVGDSIYKVYALTRQTRMLTTGFTRDPAQLHAAAQMIRETTFLAAESLSKKLDARSTSTSNDIARLGPSAESSSSQERGQQQLEQQLLNLASPGRALSNNSATGGATGSLAPRNSLLAEAAAQDGAPRNSQTPPSSGASQRQSDTAYKESLQADQQAPFKNPERTFAESYKNLEPGYDAQGSLAALEGIMRAHQWMRTRKTITLLSSNGFQVRRKDRYEEITKPVRDLVQNGFSVWTVDVPAGWGSSSGAPSDLMSMLARESGGEFLKGMSRAFTRPAQQSACFYMFSLAVNEPPERHLEYNLTVALDSQHDQQLFDYEVVAPQRAIAWSRAELDQSRRLAALLNPDDFVSPPVAVQLGFPVLLQGKQLLPARVRVPLSRLTWLPQTDGSYQASVSLDAAVEQDTGYGLKTICGVSSESSGPIVLSLPAPPKNDDRAGLSLEIYCAAQGDGLHIARAVVNDLLGDQSGAGRATMLFNRRGASAWQVSDVRVTASSGLDFVWRPKAKAAVRDTARVSGRDVDASHPAEASDQITLEYVLCGPERDQAQVALQHAIAAVSPDGERHVVQIFPSTALQLDSTSTLGPFCSQARVVLPTYSLDAGNYVFTITPKSTAPLAITPFTVH